MPIKHKNPYRPVFRKPYNQPSAEEIHPLCLRHLPRSGRCPTNLSLVFMYRLSRETLMVRGTIEGPKKLESPEQPLQPITKKSHKRDFDVIPSVTLFHFLSCINLESIPRSLRMPRFSSRYT